jgi:oligoendopeptidase F
VTTADLAPSGPRAAGVHWDLSSLAPDAATAGRWMDAALERCRAFEASYRGTIAEITAPRLAEMLRELAEIDNELSRLASYAHLREAVDVTDAENRDLSAAIDRSLVEAGNLLRFAEHEWIALPGEVADELASAPEVASDAHYLRALRRYAPHTLSEPEERVLAERAPAAVSAWQTLFSQITSTLETPFDAGNGKEPHTLDRLLALMRDPRRKVRRRAFKALYGMLEPHAGVLAHCYDTLVADRLVLDRLRDYPGPMEATHLRNEVDGEVVDRMLESVERHYGLAQRWFTTKADLLGIDRLTVYDQYAPVGAARPVRFDEAVRLVGDSFDRFSPAIGDIARGFFAERRVDAEPRAGKRGGAFCSPVAQDARPYVLLNYTDRMDDVMVMAHELGHGMHFTLAHDAQTALSAPTGLALSEIASTFGELLTFDFLLARESDPDTRRALVGERVEGAFATIFRQTVLCRFEQAAYGMRADGQTLTVDRLGEAWLEANGRYYGESVRMPNPYRLGWSYIVHFVSTRFYTYAYSFAQLVALVLYGRYRRDGDAFVEPYLEFLAAGGSEAPVPLLGRLGVDLREPAVWDEGFAEVERMIEEARAIAA